VAEPPAINASPLIFLSLAGLINLLQFISEKIIVPEAVAAEIGIRGVTDPTEIVFAKRGHGERRE
jgi:predicted nucleic acid-binding protein